MTVLHSYYATAFHLSSVAPDTPHTQRWSRTGATQTPCGLGDLGGQGSTSLLELVETPTPVTNFRDRTGRVHLDERRTAVLDLGLVNAALVALRALELALVLSNFIADDLLQFHVGGTSSVFSLAVRVYLPPKGRRRVAYIMQLTPRLPLAMNIISLLLNEQPSLLR